MQSTRLDQDQQRTPSTQAGVTGARPRRKRLNFDWFRVREARRRIRRGKVLFGVSRGSGFAILVGKVLTYLGALAFPVAFVVGFMRPQPFYELPIDLCMSGLVIATVGGLLWAVNLYSEERFLERARAEAEDAERLLKEHRALNDPHGDVLDDGPESV